MASTDFTTKSTPAETQATSSNRDEQLERLHDLQQLIGNLLDAAGEVSRLAQEIADENKDEGEVFDAAQDLIREVDDIEDSMARRFRYLTAAVRDEWAQPGFFDEGDKGGDKNDEAAA
jgi:hypothetical protein